MNIKKWIKSIFDSKKYTTKEKNRDYILWVTTKYEDDGYGSHWYGWSSNLTLTYDEAVEMKELIKDRFYDVEIVRWRWSEDDEL